MRYIKFILPALLAGFVAACGGGGSSTPAAEVPVSVTLSAQVYDQAVSNAEVSVYVGDSATPVATATTDSNGNFSVNISVTEAARANRCVVVARRDNISLRSLLGNIGAITDIATANGGTVTPTELPSVNVTNVSTAVAAIIEQAGGALPDTQAEIDAALAVIANDTTLQQTVIQIAAAIKAVVDYAGDTTSLGAAITNTEELAAALAASGTLANDLTTLVATTDATLDELVLEVEGDPLLATQIPSDEATLVAALAGNTYVTNDSAGEETLIRFDSTTTLTVADYSDIETGGTSGTYTDNQDGSFTANLNDPVDGAIVVVVTVTGGSTNAITANITVDGVDEGSQVFRRMIPVAASSSASQIGTADIVNSILVDIDTSTAVHLGATCDGSANAILNSAVGELSGATCNVAMGMLVIQHTAIGKTMHGLLADSWNGTTTSQQISVVNWKADAVLGSVASYSRMYTPIDAGVPTQGSIRLRIYPSDAAGAVSAQLRFMTVVDTAGDNIAGGNVDIYKDGVAKSKDHIVGITSTEIPSLFTGPSLLVNGSIDTGETYGLGHVSTRVGINLGNNANAKLSAAFKTTGAILTRYEYELSPITAADVAGKTFAITDLILADSGTITFNADGTGTDGSESFTWRIAAAIPATGITSVASYGTTLELTFAGGADKDYAFAKKLGTSLVVGGYNLNSDGTYAENFAVLLTPQ